MTRRDESIGFIQRVTALAERFEANARLFVLVVVAACAVEIVLGWNAFFKEVSVIRGRLREKGSSYAGVLSRAVLPALLAYDWDRMELLATQMLDDPDVRALRFYDSRGQLVFHRASKEGGETAGAASRERWDRNARRLVSDPDCGPRLAEEETEHDAIQSYNDFLARMTERFAGGEQEGKKGERVYYQDHLAPPEDGLAYALHPVRDKIGRVWGAVCIAFSLERVKADIHGALMSNLALTLFFVALVAVNQVMTRREKLQTKAMADEIAGAKAFFKEILPPPPQPVAGLRLDVASAQAPHLGGGFWAAAPRDEGLDLLLANGSTAGLAASYEAAMLEGLALRRMQAEEAPDGDAFLDGLADDAHRAGVKARLDACFCRIRRRGEGWILSWCAAGTAAPVLLRSSEELPEGTSLLARRGETLVPGRRDERARGDLELGSTDRVVLFDDGLHADPGARRFEGDALRRILVRDELRAEVLRDEVVAAYGDALPDDVLVLIVRCGEG